MSRILLATEFGGAYGHVAHLLPLGEALRRRGHDVVFAVRDLFGGELVLGRRGFHVLQAPTDTVRGPQDVAATYPGLLRLRGYHDRDYLLGMLRGWLNLLDLLRPALIVADFSPTATLAARLRGVPAGAFGTGYYCPPRRTPMPLIPGLGGEPEGQARLEVEILANINHAVTCCGGTAFAAFADALPAIADTLCTFPELDHYGPRPDQVYWGALDSAFGTARPDWPDGAGPRVLAYLAGTYRALPKLIDDLGRLGLPTLVHVRGEPAGIGALPPSLRIVREPLDLGAALSEASLVVCHANHGLCCKALLAGVPLVMLPQQVEQARLADLLAAFGAGAFGPRRADPGFDHAALIERALGDPNIAVKAAVFAERYASFDSAAAIGQIVEICEAILAQPEQHGAGE